MEKNRNFITLCFTIIIFTILLSCGKSKNQEPPKTEVPAESTPYVAIISKGWQHQFWQSVKMGADKAATEFNIKITFEGPEGDYAASKQNEMIETALNRKPAVLVLAACDSKGVEPLLEKAKAMNIPVIGFDSGAESQILITTVATDNTLAAGAAADKLAAAIGEKGEVAVLCHDGKTNTSLTGTNRRDGFVNRIKDKYPNIKIVDIQYGEGDHAFSKKLSMEMIDKYPKLKGIFATNEGAAVGLINAVIEKNKEGKIVIVGYDAGKLQKDAVRSGLMLGSISQNPVMIGYKAIEAAHKVLKGEKISNVIDTGYKWYDKTNVDSEDMKPLLYD